MSKKIAASQGHKSKRELFLELAQPDKDGFSREVNIAEFVGRYERLRFGNGADWCRDDSTLAKTYNVVRHKQGNKIHAIELHGLKKVPISKPIPKKIRSEIVQQRCVVLDVGKVECDHKDGRRDDPRLNDPTLVTLDDFQPLSKAANNAKRQHCKNCRETNLRFDARKLGYNVSQVKGNGHYRGTCIGCYWHDPKFFNQEATKPDTTKGQPQ